MEHFVFSTWFHAEEPARIKRKINETKNPKYSTFYLHYANTHASARMKMLKRFSLLFGWTVSNVVWYERHSKRTENERNIIDNSSKRRASERKSKNIPKKMTTAIVENATIRQTLQSLFLRLSFITFTYVHRLRCSFVSFSAKWQQRKIVDRRWINDYEKRCRRIWRRRRRRQRSGWIGEMHFVDDDGDQTKRNADEKLSRKVVRIFRCSLLCHIEIHIHTHAHVHIRFTVGNRKMSKSKHTFNSMR